MSRPLIIDSFAGGGGASTGIEMALGRSPDIAINHNAAALALHEANHPETLHLSENVYKIDPLDHLAGKHVGLAWFSPDCKHFSKAKGGKPVERNIRDLAWIVPGWIERIQKSRGKVDVVILENVEEFRQWGPLIETERGLMPCPDNRGQTFDKWCRLMKRLGGKIDWRELRACDYGAPTIRKRLFFIARFDGKPIVWPDPTHGAPDDPDVIASRKLPWRTAAEIIDWSLPCPSIFDTAPEIFAAHGLRAVRPLADATLSRVARGVKRYVLEAAEPFIVGLAHRDRGSSREYSLGDPLRTIHAGGGNHALVAPSIVKFQTGSTGHSITQPLATVTANSFIKRPGGAAPLGLLAPILTYAQHGGANRSPSDPLHTVTASRKDQNSLIAAFVAQQNNDGRRAGGVHPGRSAGEPLSTVTSVPQQGVVAAFVSRQFSTGIGHGLDQPSATVMADGGGKSAIITPFIQKYYGTGDGARLDDPCHSVTTRDRFGFVEVEADQPPLAEDQIARARQVADLMRGFGLWDDREFVSFDVGDLSYIILDIGMRMLTPRELFNAQGFPPDYQIDLEFEGKPLPKHTQISCCGNSVSPPMAQALVAANCQHLAEWREAAE